MPEVTPLPHELSRSVSALARSLAPAARMWTPSDHPAVGPFTVDAVNSDNAGMYPRVHL